MDGILFDEKILIPQGVLCIPLFTWFNYGYRDVQNTWIISDPPDRILPRLLQQLRKSLHVSTPVIPFSALASERALASSCSVGPHCGDLKIRRRSHTPGLRLISCQFRVHPMRDPCCVLEGTTTTVSTAHISHDCTSRVRPTRMLEKKNPTRNSVTRIARRCDKKSSTLSELGCSLKLITRNVERKRQIRNSQKEIIYKYLYRDIFFPPAN